MKYKIINKSTDKWENYKYIKFEVDNYVEFKDRKQKFVYCLSEYPFINYQKGDKIEVDLNITRNIDANTIIVSHQGIISKSYIENPHNYYSLGQDRVEGNSGKSKIGGASALSSVTLSAYETQAVYEFLYGSLEWLELYIEKSNYYPNWQQKKQIPKTITRPDIPYLDAKETKEHFLTSLSGLKAISIGKPPFLLEKLQTEFFSWLDSSGIGVNSCPAELTQSLADFHNILIGKTGEFTKRRRKEVDENIAKMTSEERQRNFHEIVAAYQEPLENEDKVFETMKGKTYKDVNNESKFAGNANQGKAIFNQIEKSIKKGSANQTSFLIEKIQKSPNEWEIKKIVTFKGYYDGRGKIEKEALVHNDANLRSYDWRNYLKVDPHLIYFAEEHQEEWFQIKQLLESSSQNSGMDGIESSSSQKRIKNPNYEPFADDLSEEFLDPRQWEIKEVAVYNQNRQKYLDEVIVKKNLSLNFDETGYPLFNHEIMFQQQQFSEVDWNVIKQQIQESSTISTHETSIAGNRPRGGGGGFWGSKGSIYGSGFFVAVSLIGLVFTR